LAEALARLLENRGLRTAMSVAGRRLALEYFSLERINAETLALYGELCRPVAEAAKKNAKHTTI